MNIVETTTWEVREVDAEGTATIDLKWDALTMTTRSAMMGNADWDSASGSVEKGMAVPALMGRPALVGKTATVVVTARGEIRSHTGIQALMEEALEGNAIGPFVKRSFADEAMKAGLQNQCLQIPDGDHEPGATWPQSNVARGAMGGGFTMTTKVDFRAIEEAQGTTVGRLDLSGDLDPSKIENPDSPAMQGEITGGKIAGEATFDMLAGRLLESLVKVDMKVNMMGMEMTSVTEVKTELLPDAE
jgi:hypothetical protein